MQVEGRVVIVTGGGSGIGEGIAQYLAENGAHIAVLDINAESAERVAKAIRDDDGSAMGVEVNLVESQEVEKAFDQVLSRFGSIDILVNNAGVIEDAVEFANMTEESWDRILRINVKSQFLCARQAAKIMASQERGRIINIASRSWLGNVGIANYSASKGAVVSLTRSLAIELGPSGITANCISPTLIVTPLFLGMPEDEQQEDLRRAKKQPIPRVGLPSDVAYAVGFFAGDEADFITGQHIYVGGGAELWNSSP